jgi:hypothetical protein
MFDLSRSRKSDSKLHHGFCRSLRYGGVALLVGKSAKVSFVTEKWERFTGRLSYSYVKEGFGQVIVFINKQ